jgi:hypothetical protein
MAAGSQIEMGIVSCDVCVHGHGPGIGRTAQGVEILSGRQLASRLASAPDALTADEVLRIAAVADQRLRRGRR